MDVVVSPLAELWRHRLVALTKMMHVLGPLNIYTANLEVLGASLNTSTSKTESFSVNSLNAFTWKDLLDLDTCTECRLHRVCPAAVGKGSRRATSFFNYGLDAPIPRFANQNNRVIPPPHPMHFGSADLRRLYGSVPRLYRADAKNRGYAA